MSSFGSANNEDNTIARKATVSILFGLLGFAVNFYPIDFVFYGSYKMSFLIGLVFPMLITLAWGWRYGLLSALAGGCQTMWILWMPGSGYGPFVSVPPFTLWIVWLGWFSRTSYNSRYGIYIGELIFRIFNTALLYTAFRWVFTLNVPPANMVMPLAVAHSIVFKEVVNGLFILFLAQAILQSNAVRRFFRLTDGEADPRHAYIYTNAIILGSMMLIFLACEVYLWNDWAPDFQNAARIIGMLFLILIGILCTYLAADAFARARTVEIRLASERIEHLNGVLKAIRNVNQLIVVEKERDRLLERACDVLIEARNYEAAWLGFLESDGTFATVKGSGFPEEVSCFCKHVMRDDCPPCIKDALARKEPLFMDRSKDCGDCFFRGQYVGKEAIIIRVEHDCRLFGLFAILLTSDATADDEEKLLLREVAGDIALALHNMELEEARKIAEKALVESEAQFRNLLECIPNVAVYGYGHDGTIHYWNKASEAVYGYTGGDAIGKNILDLIIPPELRDVIRETIEHGAQTGVVPAPSELSLMRKDGALAPVFSSHVVLKRHGREPELFTIDVDLVERRYVEARLRRAVDDLKRSNAELEQFAYVASHDLQEPLRMVSSYVQLLKRRYEGKLDSDADDFIEFAVDGASRMQTLIQDLLVYSRVGTRGKPFEPTNCEDVLGQVLSNLEVAIDEDGAVVTQDPLPTVEADASQLAQLFQNLIGNAIKFHGDEPPRVYIAAERKGDEWEFSVADNGIGIDPEFFERIFVIFQRLHGRQEYSGTGIGLAVCKKIVERHGGRMWVVSEPGKGATFYFTIPAKGGDKFERNE
ncbi:MAG: ATP-binding protein [Euryarchaeota archaeon]|nr:ATP-binding protein [Euryarchaeota archaeon]